MFIDTHAHLNYKEISNNISAILERAEQNGIEKIIVPATNYITSIEIAELVQKHKMLYGAAGIHPNDLEGFEENHFNKIEELAKEDKIIAIGEIGLDYYWEPYDKQLQKYVLTEQINIAKNLGLPVIIHNRNSTEDLMEIILNQYEEGKLKGQFHSFSAGINEARTLTDMGFYISFTGNITYKPTENTLKAYEIIKEINTENLLLETDSPYLPPIPYRGKTNEPSFIIHTARKIAELKGITLEEIAEQTTNNAKKLFGLI